MNALWWRQIVGILRLEVRKNLFSTRALPLYLMAAIPLAIGVIFVVGATSTAFPDLIRLLGVVVILRGLAIPVLGPERVRALIDRQLGRSPVVLRVLLLPATALGGFLVWAALQ